MVGTSEINTVDTGLLSAMSNSKCHEHYCNCSICDDTVYRYGLVLYTDDDDSSGLQLWIHHDDQGINNFIPSTYLILLRATNSPFVSTHLPIHIQHTVAQHVE